jgi:hypothetical protein
LNWHYLKPAVVERDCYMAEPDHTRFPHEIIFTGSRGYHPEYSFRPKLVDWLQATYGDRFGHYGNDGIRVLRQHDLNVALASAKIVVGDSCFGGRPNYVSDRYYETRGRGGMLTHPWVDGVDCHGVVGYIRDETNDDETLEAVRTAIEYCLDKKTKQNASAAKALSGCGTTKPTPTEPKKSSTRCSHAPPELRLRFHPARRLGERGPRGLRPTVPGFDGACSLTTPSTSSWRTAVLQLTEYDDVAAVLGDLHSILKTGGVLRVSLPNIRPGFSAFERGDIDWFPNSEPNLDDRFSNWLTWYSTTRSTVDGECDHPPPDMRRGFESRVV